MAPASLRRGVALADLLLGLSMLAMLALVSMSLFSTSALTSRYSQDQVAADAYLQSLLDAGQSQAFSVPPGPLALPSPPPEGWTASLTGETLDGYPVNELRRLQAVVSWKYQDKTRRFERQRIVANLRP